MRSKELELGHLFATTYNLFSPICPFFPWLWMQNIMLKKEKVVNKQIMITKNNTMKTYTGAND